MFWHQEKAFPAKKRWRALSPSAPLAVGLVPAFGQRAVEAGEREANSAVVGDVLALGQLPVGLRPQLGHIVGVLVHDALARCS